METAEASEVREKKKISKKKKRKKEEEVFRESYEDRMDGQRVGVRQVMRARVLKNLRKQDGK